MTLKVIDYSKSIIYKIVCNDLNITDVYVGNTTDFKRRKASHKNACINKNNIGYNLKIYQIIRNNGGWFNWSMIEIEKCNCNDSNEAKARERHYYEFLNSTLNTQYPNRTIKELYIKDRIKRIDYQKQYNENNKEKYNIYQKQYRLLNKDKAIEYQKQYRLARAKSYMVLNTIDNNITSIDNNITRDIIMIC